MKLTIYFFVCVICTCSCQRFGDFLTEIGNAKTRIKEIQTSPTADILSKVKEAFQQESLTDHTENLLSSGFNDFNPYEVSSLCLNHTKYVLEGILQNENWALRMIDSAGKPSSDLLDLHIRWLGNYEECTAIKATVYEDPVNKTGPSNPFDGKYCLTFFTFGGGQQVGTPCYFEHESTCHAVSHAALNEARENREIDTINFVCNDSIYQDHADGIVEHIRIGHETILQPTGLSLQIGLCVPDTCSSLEAGTLAYTLASSLPLNVTVPYPFALCQEKDPEYSSKAIAVIVVCSIFVAIVVIATAYDIIIQYVLQRSLKRYKVQPNGSAYGSIESKAAANGYASNGHVPNGEVVTDRVLNTDLYKHFNEKDNLMNRKGSDMKYKPGLPGKLLLSFSAFTNAQKILSTNQASGVLTSVNGIRFISMTWVVLGHTYAFGLSAADNIATYLPQILKRLSFQAISNATFAVDTFFVLSGLLVAYLTLQAMKKSDGAKRFGWGMFYFHRFWRLTPPYMLFLMLYVPTMKYWTSGPLWPQSTGFEVDECKDTWWKNILYVNNIIEPEKMCMAWSWYLSNDMQFYIISPLMLVPLYYSPLWGSISCFVLVLANFITTGVISKKHELGSNMILGDTSNDSFGLIYVKPWCRIGPYVVGIFTGYLLYVTDCKVKIPKIVNALGWTVATAFALLTLYGLHDADGNEKLGVDAAALYNATSRTAWGLAIAWVIFACSTGYGGPVNALLSWRAIIPLSRLTYCAYLVHPVIMYTYYFSQRTLMRWYDFELAYVFMGNLCLTYAVAFVVSLAFESPMMGLEKALLGRDKRS